jgi:hypothetical protein
MLLWYSSAAMKTHLEPTMYMYMVHTGNSLFQQQTDESLERNARSIHTISCLAAPALPAAYTRFEM